MPPTYSALKVDGKRAYDRARAGEEVAMKTRAVTIHAHPPERSREARAQSSGARRARRQPTLAPGALEITLSARVSKGTYIRSLARDIAHALGTVGHVTMLRRTKAGPFGLDQAISLDKLAELGHARRA